MPDKKLYELTEKVKDTFTKDTKTHTLSVENKLAIDDLFNIRWRHMLCQETTEAI